MLGSRLGCGQRAVAVVQYRMARRGSHGELGNHIQRIAGGNRAHRSISVDGLRCFPALVPWQRRQLSY